VLPELVAALRRFGELNITDDIERALLAMSAATMDRRLSGDRAKLALRGRSHTKPGSLLKSQIPIRTWAQWDDAVPGFVEIDLVGHEGGNAVGEHCYTLTVTDIATGWTENRTVPNKARKWVIAALEEVAKIMPFPILSVDSDNGSEFINHHLLDWCEKRQITFTRSRPGNSNDGAQAEGEELGRRTHRRRIPPLRHHRGTVAAEQDLGSAVADDELFLTPAEADLQDPRWSQDHQEIRSSDHPAPAG